MGLIKKITVWMNGLLQSWSLVRQERRREARYRGCWQMRQSAWGYQSQADREETKKWL